MAKTSKKLKMNVKGGFHQLWANTVFMHRLKRIGLKVDLINHKSLHHTEVIITGEPVKLWQAIEMIKAPSYLLKMDKVSFEFIDL
jgi:hypothetical protein